VNTKSVSYYSVAPIEPSHSLPPPFEICHSTRLYTSINIDLTELSISRFHHKYLLLGDAYGDAQTQTERTTSYQNLV